MKVTFLGTTSLLFDDGKDYETNKEYKYSINNYLCIFISFVFFCINK